jgi:hypothetical protein
VQGGELGVEDLDKFFKNTWTALRKHDPLLGRRYLQDQQRLPEHVLQVRQQLGSAHQQLHQSVRRQLQQQQQQWQQPNLSEGHEGNGQQAAAALQSLQKQQQLQADLAAATGNGDVWPGPMHSLVAQQLQQQQQQDWLLQHRLGSMLLEAATHAGMALEALLNSPPDRQAQVLSSYLSLPQGKAAVQTLHRLATPFAQAQRQQQQQQQRRRLSLEQQAQQHMQQQQPQLPPPAAVQQQQPEGLLQQKHEAELEQTSTQNASSNLDASSMEPDASQEQQQQPQESEGQLAVAAAGDAQSSEAVVDVPDVTAAAAEHEASVDEAGEQQPASPQQEQISSEVSLCSAAVVLLSCTAIEVQLSICVCMLVQLLCRLDSRTRETLPVFK